MARKARGGTTSSPPHLRPATAWQSITPWPHPGARPNCYPGRETGVPGRRWGEASERCRAGKDAEGGRGAQLPGPPSLLPAEAGCLQGLTQSDHGRASQEAPPPRRSDPRWPQLRTRGLQRGRPATARAHQAALPCTARGPLAFKPGGPGSSESTQDGLPRASQGLGLPVARSLALTRLGSAHRGSPVCSWSWRSWAPDRQTPEEAPSPGCGPPTGRADQGTWELLCGCSRPF